jgi:hypothetical protein
VAGGVGVTAWVAVEVKVAPTVGDGEGPAVDVDVTVDTLLAVGVAGASVGANVASKIGVVVEATDAWLTLAVVDVPS